ncbi:Regulatory protein repA [Burkholderia pseudomallei]|uniref:helicase RepA family protein n=1 Tax=Burkholderia pseudomallei TaxID=28450 RepID=UPI000F083D27|nr:helicase RepA family protein [Burkholderia pseudomallei]MBF4048823.1 AAA family ATPase [Burkholderia pseudomallei]CAJ4115016.1 Regulatory protein repA [Burkholderia pseudomallei]CAJ5046002.1 Regulatory protein repA [Burkholderia pseudomallei]CAJ6858122.1 Regulatory protein repA [Burkholderia pseudomallei]CAJ7292101.1 Regulatory protein repA [Burkholderia pseudomallei]
MLNLSALKLDIRQTLTTTPPELDHVLPGLLAGSLGVVTAPGGTGKSMFLMQTALAIATGQPVLEGALDGSSPSAPSKVVTIFAEETRDVLHHRLHGAVGQLFAGLVADDRPRRLAMVDRLAANLFVYPLGGEGRLLCTDGDDIHRDGFRQMLECCQGARLVVVDPLRRFHNGDENDSGHMTDVVEAFQRIAKRTGAAVLLAHHTNRSSMLSGMGDQATASRGSSALTDGVRWQANLSSLSEPFAEKLGIANQERRFFVRFDVSKANYVQPIAPVVLRKIPDTGALVRWPVEQSAAGGGRRKRVTQ